MLTGYDASAHVAEETKDAAWLARAAGDDLGKPQARLRVDGGLTRSRVLMQTQADLLQAPVEVYVSPHATALGVAALARLGLGAATSAAEAVGTWEPAAVCGPPPLGTR